MHVKESFQIIDHLHPMLPEVIALSIGNLTNKKIHKVLNSYKPKDNYLIGYFLNSKMIGVIGVALSDYHVKIRHISILLNYQRRGIGKKLIDYIIKHYNVNSLQAETDD
ncbi:MAG: Acetyltransferase [Rickettsiaceae bacterium]|jgi:ribosomal protein S18 acetylase RimI-like enzyme|nr:Acetyltransferase [Rickettsiaceae bacterium]